MKTVKRRDMKGRVLLMGEEQMKDGRYRFSCPQSHLMCAVIRIVPIWQG